MNATLRPPAGNWALKLLLLLLVLGVGGPALASHLVGGELTYRYLDAAGPSAAPLRYELTVTVYNNCDGTGIQPRSVAYVGIYDQATGTRFELTPINYHNINALSGVSGLLAIPQTSATNCISPTTPSGCTVTGPSQPYILQKFTAVVNLPFNPAGYYAVFSDASRNVDVANLRDPGGQNMTLYTALQPPAVPNRSPVFSDVAVAVICANDTTLLLNNAVDPDGDRLAYSFGQPYGAYVASASVPVAFTPPPVLVPYVVGYGYSATAPFGTGPGKLATLDPNTGVASYSTPTQGKYVVAVDVKEYRTINGVEMLIGTTRRDLQLVVASCPDVKAPVLPATTATPRTYTVEAGATLTVPITVTQRDNHPLQMTLNSELFDGAGGHDASLNGSQGTVAAGSLTGTATVSGTNGTVTGTLVFATTCTENRPTPYSITLSVKDTGCAGKTVYEVFNITVTRPTGPTAIAGDAAVCGLNNTHSYLASGGTVPTVGWRAPGGTIVGSPTANPVQVVWPTAGTFTLTAWGISQYGCRTDSVHYAVTVTPGATLTATGPTTICVGGSTTIGVSGGSAYTVTGGAAPLAGAGPFTLNPAATTTYTITDVGSTGGCQPTTQVTVTVQPPPTVNVGPATRSACSGEPLQLGAAPLAGYTYRWAPATGLSNPAIANPTLTLTNTTTALLLQTYTLTVTSPIGCTNTGTVTVLVNVPVVGGSIAADQTVCAGSAPLTLSSTSSGNNSFGYQWESAPDNATWSPIAGASGASYAPPALTATTYFRRRATLGSCNSATSNVVKITVTQPLQAAVALAQPPVQCAGLPYSFAPVPTNGGSAPTYVWYVNNIRVAATTTYSSTTLADGDVVRVELTPTAGFCAVGPAVAAVTIHLTPVPLPAARISSRVPLPVCTGTTLTFEVSGTTNLGATATYQWQVDGVPVAGATGTSYTSSQLRNGQLVTVALSTPTICGPVTVTSNAVRVGIVPPLAVSAGPDQEIMEGEEVILEGTANGRYPLFWTPAASLRFVADTLHPRASPLATTTYVLSAQVGNCVASDSVTVVVRPRLRIPTAFSPNGDGQDDVWEIDHLGDYPANKVLVFNRWGNKIFEGSGYAPGTEWNGTTGGQPVPIGTYYYLITLGNGRKYSGPITIVY